MAASAEVRSQGRHRYHELAGPDVAAAVEAVARLAPPAPVRSLRQHRASDALAEARTCYDHLAGRRGVELRDLLLGAGAVEEADERDHVVTARGEDLLAGLGLDVRAMRGSRRVFARSCLDVTHRRPHLAGELPAALTGCFVDRGWLRRGRGRVLHVATGYDDALAAWLGRR